MRISVIRRRPVAHPHELGEPPPDGDHLEIVCAECRVLIQVPCGDGSSLEERRRRYRGLAAGLGLRTEDMRIHLVEAALE